jgi:hypothetical protein
VSRFKHISNRGLENFPETLAGVIEDSIRKQEQFKLSRQSAVEDPIRSIETFSQRFGLSQAETEVVRQSYYLEQGGTMFHIINAFTRAARIPIGLDTLQAYRWNHCRRSDDFFDDCDGDGLDWDDWMIIGPLSEDIAREKRDIDRADQEGMG